MKKLQQRTLVWFTAIVTVFTLFCSGLSFGMSNPPGKLSLADAVKRGLKNNFGIQIAKQNVEVAKQNNSWGFTGALPTVNVGLNFNNGFNNDPGGDPGSRNKFWTHTITPSVNLRWVLFSGLSMRITKKKLGDLNKLSEGNSAVVVENTIQGIVLAYYKVLLEKEKLKVVDEVKKLSKDRYDYVLARKEVGTATTYDGLQAKIAWLDDRSISTMQRVNVRNAKRNLNLAMGEPPYREYILTDSFSTKTNKYDLDLMLNKLRSNNKTLKNQYINQKILKKDTQIKKGNLYPTITLNSGVSRTGRRVNFIGASAVDTAAYDYYVNFSVTMNLFSGGNIKREIKKAKIQEKIGELQTKDMKSSLGSLLRSTYEMYDVKKELLKLASERMASAKLNMDISDEKFKSGVINSFNYRDVQLVYLNSSFGKLQAIFDLVETHSELMRLTGGIITEY